jgi:predicted polyphosphate/ATP-dependent NAD kinase
MNCIVYNLTTTFSLVAGEEPIEVAQRLAQAVYDAVDPLSWEVMGGGGTLRLVHRKVNTKAWMLMVRQSEANHNVIKDVLNQMKSA